MRDDRFGSYSIAATLAGIPVLSRRKSIDRYLFAWPPPRCHAVTSPCEFLPPVRFFDSVNDFSGVCFVMSLLSSMVRKRRDGVYGLNVFSGIFASCLSETTDSPRIRSSFRRLPASRTPSSSPAGSLQRGRGGETFRGNSRCARDPLSP